MRSTANGWRRGSVVGVDAGVHLAAIVKILEKHQSDYSPDNDQRPVTLINGPFDGLEIPHYSAKANAGYITSTLIDTCLITHPHLDHISAFVVNTAGLPASRQKTLAGLETTIQAFSNHIFNNVIWPNLSDENNGAGLVTYKRLVDGGSPAMGDGDGKGYVEICEGLSVKTWSISHGTCIENHIHHGSTAGLDSSVTRPGASPHPSHDRGSQARSHSMANLTPTEMVRSESHEQSRPMCVYDSSAYFIRDMITGTEALIFGDVEPDSLSLSPRNMKVWTDAAPKIVSGRLRGIFIECSYDDSQTDDRLYGHMTPRFLIEELKALAREVERYRAVQKKEIESKKRKWPTNVNPLEERSQRRTTRASNSSSSPASPRTQVRTRSIEIGLSKANTTGLSQAEGSDGAADGGFPIRNKGDLPLKNLRIIVIHVKDKLTDGPEVGDIVLQELEEHEVDAQLGCTFTISKAGQAIYL